MKSLESLRTPQILRSLVVVLLICSCLSLFTLFLPWRQTVTGSGQVTVFSPSERPQEINTLIDAKIVTWHVQEGDKVHRGDLLVELEELNPSYLDDDQLMRLAAQRQANIQKRRAAESMVDTLEGQTETLQQLQQVVVPSAGVKVSQSKDKVVAAEQKVEAARQSLSTADLNLNRRKLLYDKGLSSKRDLELAELDLAKSQSELQAAVTELDVSRRDISVADYDVGKTKAEATLKIQSNQAMIAQSYEKIAQINSEIYKMDIDLSNLRNRIDQRKIYAPVDGQITRMKAYGSARTVKAGETIAVIVPKTADQAAEIFVPDYFAPLVSVGRQVRLQFSGWPALQFGGWPSAQVGTFAGVIAVVDAYSAEDGQFRLLVKPDRRQIKKHHEQEWPTANVLRPGTKATAWIILDEVPVWFELWRILNGFPPTVMYFDLDKSLKKASI